MGQLGIRGRVSAAGIAGLGVGVFIVWGTASLPEASRAFPHLIGYLMIGLGLLEILRIGIAGQNAAEKLQDNQPKERIDMASVWKFIGLTAVYVVLLPIVGFYVTTLAFMIFGIRFLGVDKIWAYLIVPVAVVGLLYFAFTTQLRIPLPSGLLI